MTLKTPINLLPLLLATLVLSFPAQTLACSCISQGRFVKVAQDHPVIIRATVLSLDNPLPFADRDHYRNMTVRVDDVIHGGDYDGEMIFTGDTGSSCLTYITGSHYPVGSEHLIATSSLFPEQNLSGCGEPSVRILGDRVVGIDPDRPLQPNYTMSLDDVLDELPAP